MQSTEAQSTVMQIAVIGAGRVGRTLGGRWTEAGHAVTYGVRDPADARHADLPARSVAAAVAGADLVLLALPWDAVETVVRATDFGDAVVVDATNPLTADAARLALPEGGSGAELVAGWSGTRRVVKAFNTTGSQNMADPSYPTARPMLPVAADDGPSKSTVMDLAGQIGFDAVDAGPLSASADLEHLALLWIRMAYALGNGPDIAFALLRR